jgi:hypothetical protein
MNILHHSPHSRVEPVRNRHATKSKALVNGTSWAFRFLFHWQIGYCLSSTCQLSSAWLYWTTCSAGTVRMVIDRGIALHRGPLLRAAGKMTWVFDLVMH